MSVQIQGVINGKQIELDHEVGLPYGLRVIVDIQANPLSLEEKRQQVDVLCGAWADDTSIDQIFADIEQQRAATTPREVDLHASS